MTPSVPRPLFVSAVVSLALTLGGCSWIGDLFGGGSGGGSPFVAAFAPASTEHAADSATPVVVDERYLSFLARENGTGVLGTDLNGDGDLLDTVPVIVNMFTGFSHVPGASAENIALIGSRLFFVTDEDRDGFDWDRDGVPNDLVLLQAFTGKGAPTYVATLDPLAGTGEILRVGDRLYFIEAPPVPFTAPATTLSYVTGAAPTTPVRVLNGDVANTLRPRLVGADEGLLFLYQDETVEGRDLNADADSTDGFVLALLDATDASAVIQSVALPLPDASAPVRALSTGTFDWLVGFLVDEAAQGATNLNDPALFLVGWQPPQCIGFEDADAADQVLHFLDFAAWSVDPITNPPINTGLVGVDRIVAIDGSPAYLVTVSLEASEGGCPLNGDGDGVDRILRWVPAQVPSLPFTDVNELVALTDTPGGTHGVTVLDGRLIATVNELADGRDHNNNPADANLVAWLDPSDGAGAVLTYNHAAVGESYAGTNWISDTVVDGRLPMSLREDVAMQPLNSGDLDILDNVAAFARFDPADPTDLDFPAATVAVDSDRAQIVVARGMALYIVEESQDNRDWNEDTDLVGDFDLFRTDLDDLTDTEFITEYFSFDFPEPTVNGDIGGAVLVNEISAGQDLNGDLDANDFVVLWFRFF
jgi:hypothetical protein